MTLHESSAPKTHTFVTCCFLATSRRRDTQSTNECADGHLCDFARDTLPLEPPPVSPARGPPTDWEELVQAHDDRAIFGEGRIQPDPPRVSLLPVRFARPILADVPLADLSFKACERNGVK